MMQNAPLPVQKADGCQQCKADAVIAHDIKQADNGATDPQHKDDGHDFEKHDYPCVTPCVVT